MVVFFMILAFLGIGGDGRANPRRRGPNPKSCRCSHRGIALKRGAVVPYSELLGGVAVRGLPGAAHECAKSRWSLVIEDGRDVGRAIGSG